MGIIKNIRNRMFEHMATEDEVYDRLGPEMGKVIIEERRIVFYRYGLPIGVFLGMSVLFMLIYFKLLVGSL